MTPPLKHTIIGLALGALPLAAQHADGPLVANAQKDAMGIAEQLYVQARSARNSDPTQRSADLTRAAELFARYVEKYPRAEDKDKALYLQAVCLEEAGNPAAANALLGTLTNTMHGEYAAAAAYKLGTQAADRSLWDKAVGYYRIVITESARVELQHDALYRLGKAQLQQGRRKDAEATFRRLVDQRNIQPALAEAGLLALAQMKTEDHADTEAYGYYRRLLALSTLSKSVRGMVTLQAARLAGKLGHEQEAQDLYDKMSAMDDMEQYTAEAQLDTLVRLYKKGDFEGIIRQVNKNYRPLNSPEKEARRALIAGQAYMDLERYEQAAQWFEVAERQLPGSATAADAAYRRIVCAQHLRANNIISLAQRFLSTYAVPDSPAASMPVCDWVRFTLADRIMPSDVEEAARQFDAVRIENLPASIRADAEYKKAWSAAQGSTYDPIPTLNHFISTYKDDPRLPEAYTLRGTVYAKQGKTGEALRDFDYVIDNYPKADVLPACWQKAAKACTTDPQRMIRYYEGLIACRNRPNVKPAAIAEAHYSIACALYDTRPADAIPHFREARAINPEHYGARVDASMVQCYFKLKDAENLQKALENLQKANPASYKAQPPGILRWCGWMCYQKKNYVDADRYLSDALEREPKEVYTAPNGSKQERPKVEPLVWKCLAKSRLELRRYRSGYEAAQHYVSMETQPYRKAEGMRDMAQLLLGMKRAEEARALCEEAISMGIDGPIKSSVFVTLGDTYYAGKNYNEAAKYYGRVANVVSDQDLKPLATYKLVCALSRGGKAVEAQQYKTALKNDFPGWFPPADARALMESADQ